MSTERKMGIMKNLMQWLSSRKEKVELEELRVVDWPDTLHEINVDLTREKEKVVEVASHPAGWFEIRAWAKVMVMESELNIKRWEFMSLKEFEKDLASTLPSRSLFDGLPVVPPTVKVRPKLSVVAAASG